MADDTPQRILKPLARQEDLERLAEEFSEYIEGISNTLVNLERLVAHIGDDVEQIFGILFPPEGEKSAEPLTGHRVTAEPSDMPDEYQFGGPPPGDGPAQPISDEEIARAEADRLRAEAEAANESA